jgi:mycothiol synthase
MAIQIEPDNQKNYPQIAAVLAAAIPYAATSAEIIQYRDETRPSHCHFRRFVAVHDNEVVGFGAYTQYADMYEPDAFWANVCVMPAFQRQGIGTALYRALRQSLATREPYTLRAQIREDCQAGVTFATKQGFQEFGRRWESSLDVAAFDAKRFSDYTAQVEARGLKIVPFTKLANDPERERKLYQLQTELDQDVPMLVAGTPMTFEQFSDQVLKNPSLVADGLMVAIAGDEYVGMSSLFEVDAKALVIDLTGTKMAYRRQGIAMALKLEGILFARRQGYERIEVHNDLTNQGMIAINEKLGFVRGPAIIQYAQLIRPEMDLNL